MSIGFYDPGEQRATKVNALFRRIAGRYDLINDIQSFGLHRAWKRLTASLAAVGPGCKALDICCGTGDISLALARRGSRVLALDFTAEMLSLAEQRKQSSEEQGEGRVNYLEGRIFFVRGDAERLPFHNDSFDAVTVGYGLRNLRDWKLGIQEMQRVAKPGGRLVILEFGKPENRAWQYVVFSYLRVFVPSLGAIFYGDPGTYRYILESLNHYPSQVQIAAIMRDLGLANVRLHNLLGGAMSIHYAEKASACQV